MNTSLKYYLTILSNVIGIVGILCGSALGMTIDAIDDAGQYPGQNAYVKFVYDGNKELPVTTSDVSQPWTSKQEVIDYADSKEITGWELQSAGNIWSSNLIVGDSLTGLAAGIYRISVVDGAFMYDSFGSGWSVYEDQWRWELHIQARRALINGQIVDYYDYMLGSYDPYSSEEEALQVNFGQYIDIPLADRGSLIFWIYDNPNAIDNSGSLTFNVALIPEPSTFILAGTGLFFLARRFRRSLTNLFTH